MKDAEIDALFIAHRESGDMRALARAVADACYRRSEAATHEARMKIEKWIDTVDDSLSESERDTMKACALIVWVAEAAISDMRSER